MRQDLARAFAEVADQFAVVDPARPGEWKCRLCNGQTTPDGPIMHTPICALTLLHDALESEDE